MGELHAKFHQNWWSGFRDILLPYTDGHSFIIIRIHNTHTYTKKYSGYIYIVNDYKLN